MNRVPFRCADSSVVEHTIADCEVDGSIPPRRFFPFSYNKQFILQFPFSHKFEQTADEYLDHVDSFSQTAVE